MKDESKTKAINRRFILILIIVFGVLVSIGGFFDDAMFAGLPYQDPTPELEANYRFHSEVASAIEQTGLGIIGLGFVGLIVVDIWRMVKKRQNHHETNPE
jgi:hypothetical protein